MFNDPYFSSFTIKVFIMIITCMILIEGDSVTKASLNISLTSAKQIVVGRSPGFGFVVHVAANSPSDLQKAILKFGGILNVTAVTILRLHPAQG